MVKIDPKAIGVGQYPVSYTHLYTCFCISYIMMTLLWTFQSKFLNKERKLMTILSCPKCGILKQGVPEDIDKYVDEILDKILDKM